MNSEIEELGRYENGRRRLRGGIEAARKLRDDLNVISYELETYDESARRLSGDKTNSYLDYWGRESLRRARIESSVLRH